MYTYCANNPIISIDPSGHFILAAMLIGAAAGALISGSVSLYHESKSAGGISNMTADNWKNVGISAGVGGICGGIGGGFGALGASATGSLLTSSAASPLIASTATNTLGYAVGTGMAGGMAGSYTSTATQQILYGYNDPYELMQNTAVGGITGGGFGAVGYKFSSFSNKKIPTRKNPLSNIKYTNKVLKQATQEDFHGFPECVDSFGSYGTSSLLRGMDGIARTKVEIKGNYKGYDGAFEYIIEPDNTCNHRYFRANKK